ncbi:hypothetical protein [Candidatus Nitronereus thalassa]|uniref:Uncharacterized protein n=1 Tax=Candidatus Nitronereus thalassa TaxID=3020898 RepID=A0ABU3K992_9BACT|nr:hypothetical protein [Candidatus Nitronereus thalassa]MDT7042951.1 hypothetical protein [Candidatus Nitronereus thalassa]
MILASVFGSILFLLLVIGDWYQFTSLRPLAALYGFGIARRTDPLDDFTAETVIQRFGKQATIELPHGIARWFEDQKVITLRPYYQLFTLRFRTAWPLKGTIELHSTETGVELRLTKRMPWSSSIITMAWLALVIIGTAAFLIMFGIDGGFGTAGGLLMALGVAGLGVLVLLFGLIMISLAYRLEDSRLMQVYQELQDVLLKKSKKSSEPSKEITPA